MYSHWAMRYPKLPKHRRDLQIPVPFRTTKAGEDFLFWQCASKHILIFSTADKIRLLAAMKTLAHTRLYHNGINNCLPSMPLWRVSWCQQSTVDVRVKILEHTDLYFKLY
ncbi:hypothetical protein T06_15652 [Trichinella sp. T6]|nr:hypothetical protein T06_15652 [Trichinella sp. T6]